MARGRLIEIMGTSHPGHPSLWFLLGALGCLAWSTEVVYSCFQARDNDSGNNGAILFSILQVNFITKDGTVIPFHGFFRISTSSEDNVFIGNIE